MQIRNPNYQEDAKSVFEKAPFIRLLGAELLDVSAGRCCTRIWLRGEHQQQDGFIHAGVQATLADHTAGTAASTLVAEGERVLTAEFKINLLRPASGDALYCEAEVLKAGKHLTVVESVVYSELQGGRACVAKATVTLAIVKPVS